MTRTQLRKVVLGGFAGMAMLGLQPVAAATPASLAPQHVIMADPAIGPHSMDEARHRRDAFHPVAPANAAIVPRRARAATAASTMAAAASVASSSGNLTREVLGFAPYWALENNVQVTWKYNLVSTLAFFGLTMNADGSLVTNDRGWNAWNGPAFVDMANRAHTLGDRVVVVIKAFNNDSICGIVYGAGQTAITNIIQQIQAKTIDGVNVDFEGSNTTCVGHGSLQSGLTAFIAQLSAQVHTAVPGSSVTIDTFSGAASWDAGEFKIDDLAKTSIDAMFIMAYDMNFANMVDAGNHDHAGPTAPLTGWTYNDTLSVQQYLSKAPASKIILGVPYYGYKWSTTTDAPYALTSGGAEADTYANVLSDLSCASQLKQSWDGVAMSPWASWVSPATGDPCGANLNSSRELYYDNATSLGLKYDLVNNNNLRGTGMWTLSYQGTSPDLWNEISLKFVAPWEPLGGGLAGGPAATASASTGMDVFVRGPDNHLYHRKFSGSAWGNWEGLGGLLNAEPAAIASANGRIDVVVRGLDNGLWHLVFDGTNWGNWETLGGGFNSGPSIASWGSGRLDVFGLGKDNAVWHKAFDGTTWGQWESLGGGSNAGPGAVSWGPNHIDLFVRGLDNALWHRAFDAGTWGQWEGLGGGLTSGPAAASWGVGRLDVVARGGDGGLWHEWWDGTRWNGWLTLTGRLTDEPAVASSGSGRFDVFVRGDDGGLWHKAVFIY